MTAIKKALVGAALSAVAMGMGGGVAAAGGWHDDDPGGHGCILKNGEQGVYTYQHSNKGRHHFHCTPKNK